MRALALLVALAGCTPIERTFHCTTAPECVHDGVAGACEPTGLCSFPDGACASGRRYGAFSGELANQCVVDGVAAGACVPALAVGNGHACALGRDGGVVCWGKNDHGQVGNGGTSDVAAAVPVVDDHGVPIANVVAVTAGDAHTCALRGDKTALCWGDDSAGQLGRGGAAAQNPVPSLVALTDIVAIAAGARHTCAALSSGAVWCWGANDAGQLGTPPSAGASMPVEVVDRAGKALAAATLAAGATHSCATTMDGHVVCWGSDADGELGDATEAASALPVQAVLPSGQRALAAGAHFTCALDDTGAVCFGLNDQTQTGQPAGAPVLAPAHVAVDGVVALGAGAAHACALATGGVLSCWGDGGGVMHVADGVGAIGVGAGDVCRALADRVVCATFGDPDVTCK